MKLKRFAALLMTLCVFCLIGGHSAFADYKTLITLTINDSSSGGGDNEGKYIVVIPESLAPTTSGWTAFTGGVSIKTAEGSTFSADKKLVISADSANNWKLVLSPDKSASIAYTLNTSSTDTTATTTFEYSAASIDAGVSQDLGIIVSDYTGKPAGTYGDTITFHVNVQDAETTGKTITLAADTGEVIMEDGDTLTGTGGEDTHVIIAAGATITLQGVTITSIPDNSRPLLGRHNAIGRRDNNS